MFESITKAPPDAILGLTEVFKADPNPDKINLSIGVYKDADGTTPVLASVQAAQQQILVSETTKAYKPIPGTPEYAQTVQTFMFGEGSDLVTSGRACTSHTPGGTGALRVAGDYLKQNHPNATLWLSDETWPNHPQIFNAAGVAMKSYPYFDKPNNALNFDAMIEALRQIPAGDVVLLHGCCHNPTGVDLTVEQWAAIGDVLAERNLVPLIDFAYQGFAEGIEQDAAGLRSLSAKLGELIVCSSFSKNFGLYCERVGALTMVAATPGAADAVQSQVKRAIRANYSNPPAHGAAIVTTILNDAALRQQWEQELATMRDRINGMRRLFTQTLDAHGIKLPGGDNSFITQQKGMFSYTGLSKPQVEQLRDKFAIYIVNSGRINVAGITEANMARLCEAIAAVL